MVAAVVHLQVVLAHDGGERPVSPDPPPTGRGYDAFTVVSALQKAIRRSSPESAAHWAAELQLSGYGPWCWSRLRTICVEDIGPADRTLPATIAALEDWATRSKDGGGGMEIVTAAILLATAKKSRVSCWLLIREGTDHRERIEIPPEALDRHTMRGKKMGRSHEHFFTEAQTLIDPLDAARSRGYASVEEELAALEAQADQHARQLRFEGPEGLPQNPWRHGEPGSTSEQLRLDSEEPR